MRHPGSTKVLSAHVFFLAVLVGAACNGGSIEVILPTPTVPQGVVVQVIGEVQKPGTYTLPPGSNRLLHAVEAAGGFTANADREAVNLAAPLSDGQQVYVPSLSPSEIEGDAESSVTTYSLININTASSETLQTLKGIGPVKAQAIIDYRDTNGPFQRIEDIIKVTGIGERTFEDIRHQITVR